MSAGVKYYNDLCNYSRIKTREVMVGNVGVGGSNPIRVQSMTTTDTMDTDGSVKQSIKMIKAGCELVRLTAPSIRDARNLLEIKNQLIKKGYNTPLIADIHFTPNAAIEAAKIVEKVRINPGNYTDKKKFQIKTYSKHQYQDELKRIEEKLVPLIEVCKSHNTAMRIGTNHGSLSDRIMSQYGDTPLGMVESALEFVRICEKHNYKQIILSMKASNPIVMIHAYRLLVANMKQEGMNYPLHLGVTEAGEGNDGRIKSAIGIGSLLMDGIGDTIRVSLTESPEHEIPIAQSLVDYVEKKKNHQKIVNPLKNPINSFVYTKRNTKQIMNIGGKSKPVVFSNLCFEKHINKQSLFKLGYRYSDQLDKWTISDTASDYLFLGDNDIDFNIPGSLGLIYNYKTWKKHKKGYPLLSSAEYLDSVSLSKKLNIIDLFTNDFTDKLMNKLKDDGTAVLLIESDNINSLADYRRLFIQLMSNDIVNPVLIRQSYNSDSRMEIQLEASVDIGPLLLDGLGDGLLIIAKNYSNVQDINEIGFNILQATRTRISKTEYISCPSCGRTLFNLEETTAKIRLATGHLKGLKIGVMGCIVNGPGEMADADYGYVGTGLNKVSLYKQKELVKRNISSKKALDELIQLIRENGDWVDP
ncbi:MAG: 4-hydroxy-3-methylbut-2-en-1-yl diphosphate synthase [Flavobacteriales bacterium]|nr:4-hydroxy-3-methylbut-2-en-1-yl diphosphate synthase [Flavobacteriales bacterium]|tara:strand:- start:86 stop:2008 length:1923 start_codon:yes stop_codon:yes gene_type:complete